MRTSYTYCIILFHGVKHLEVAQSSSLGLFLKWQLKYNLGLQSCEDLHETGGFTCKVTPLHTWQVGALSDSNAQSCLTLRDPEDYRLPGSYVPGIFQAKILEWVAISFSRGSFLPRDRTRISCVSCIADILYPLSHRGSPSQGQLLAERSVPPYLDFCIGLLECFHNMVVAIPKESDNRERVRWKSYVFHDLT